MKKEYVFRDKNNDFYVVGQPECAVTGDKIINYGFVRVVRNGWNLISINGLKKVKETPSSVEQFFQFFITQDVQDDFVLINFKLPSMVNGDSISVFDIEKIDKKFPSETIDKTRFANRGGLDDTAVIGSPDMKRLEELDKPLDDVDGLLKDIMDSKVVVSESNIIMIGSDKNDVREKDNKKY